MMAPGRAPGSGGFQVPEFSILMPAYNYGRFVGQAIDSVLAQTHADFELIVVESGSDDNTWDVVSTYDDPRLIAVRTEQMPLTHSLAIALERANGTWVTNLNADDRFQPETLAAVSARLGSNPAIGVLGVHLRTIDADGYLIEDQVTAEWVNTTRDLNDPEAWIWANYLTGCAFIRRSSLIDVGGYGDLDTILDWDLWIRALAAGEHFDVLPEVLFEWRRHGANITGSRPLATVEQYGQVARRTLLPFLRRSGRDDLVARTLAGFITNDVLAHADPQVRRMILDEVVYDCPREELDQAMHLVAEEVLRLREYYTQTAVAMRQGQQQLAGLTSELDERTREVTALADRLHACEADRRQAQAQLEAIQSRAVYRAARKAAHVLRRRPG